MVFVTTIYSSFLRARTPNILYMMPPPAGVVAADLL